MAFMGIPGQAHALNFTCDADSPGACSFGAILSGNQLKLDLTNTSPAANGGYITAVAFDLAGAASITGVATTDADFFLTPGPINVAPAGSREFVMSISNVYLGGGSPVNGIGVGGSATFTFTLGGTFGGVSESNVLGS